MGGSLVESGCVAILINPSFSSTSNNGSPLPQKKKKCEKKREKMLERHGMKGGERNG
jgi:hypothetical protein